MKTVVQKDNFGCGVACVATILDILYQQALKLFTDGQKRARASGFYCKEIVRIFQKCGRFYEYRYVNKKMKERIYAKGAVVFIERSKKYPAGHFLTRSENTWMDPWINFQKNKNIFAAKAGFRKRLPGRPIYAILPK